jgi:hypothetical protein
MLTLLPPATALTDDCPVSLVAAHWNDMRAGRVAPQRDQIDAQAIAAALPHVFIAQLVAPRVARMRIVGHKVEALVPYDLRGMPLTALFMGSARDLVMESCAQVQSGARAILSLEGARKMGQPPFSARMALFPLCDASGQITHLLGVLNMSEPMQPVRGERRFIAAQPLMAEALAAQPKSRPTFQVITGGRA